MTKNSGATAPQKDISINVIFTSKLKFTYIKKKSFITYFSGKAFISLVIFTLCGITLKGFEAGRVLYDEQSLKVEYIRDFDRNETDSLRNMGNYLRQAILEDLDEAERIWQKDGADKQAERLVNVDNLHVIGDLSILGEKGYKLTFITDNTKKINYYKSFLKDLKTGVDVIDIDYALTGDSLVICVYKYFYKSDNKHNTQLSNKRYINFIHVYNCDTNEWVLSDVNSNKDYFPEIYKYDYLRKSICNDIYNFILINNLLRLHNGEPPKDLRRIVARLIMPNNIFIYESEFPTGTDEAFLDEFNNLPRDYGINKHKTSYYFYKNPNEYNKLRAIQVDYKLDHKTVVVEITYKLFDIKKNEMMTSIYGHGYFVHKYDCEQNEWIKSYEQIYL